MPAGQWFKNSKPHSIYIAYCCWRWVCQPCDRVFDTVSGRNMWQVHHSPRRIICIISISNSASSIRIRLSSKYYPSHHLSGLQIIYIPPHHLYHQHLRLHSQFSFGRSIGLRAARIIRMLPSSCGNIQWWLHRYGRIACRHGDPWFQAKAHDIYFQSSSRHPSYYIPPHHLYHQHLCSRTFTDAASRCYQQYCCLYRNLTGFAEMLWYCGPGNRGSIHAIQYRKVTRTSWQSSFANSSREDIGMPPVNKDGEL